MDRVEIRHLAIVHALAAHNVGLGKPLHIPESWLTLIAHKETGPAPNLKQSQRPAVGAGNLLQIARVRFLLGHGVYSPLLYRRTSASFTHSNNECSVRTWIHVSVFPHGPKN